ncbi:hypothetical protein [Flavisericum labens]|uniref:hypothetical protein n=1 Tax=Flavisericum labens TaxID=3377112 RepID=UPI00387B0BDA
MKKLIKFYDLIFLYHYNKSKMNDSDPEVVPIVVITFSQASNFMVLYIVSSYFLGLNDYISIGGFFLILCVIIFFFNIYYFGWKKRYEIISEKYILIPSRIKYISAIYLILSIITPLILIYFFNEFGNGFDRDSVGSVLN